MLVKLGLAPKRFTVKAVGKKAPLPRRVKRRVITGPTRRSLRLAGLPTPNYKEERIEENTSPRKTISPPPLKRVKRATARQMAMAAKKRPSSSLPRCSRTSVKFLNVDVERLHSSWLGKIVPPMGGQVKRAVMELAVSSKRCSPKFSRMSGIQEWNNAVMLFVNVYGDEYKNVFLEDGRQITWFAQSRQWEGTPVIQRLIHCAGGCVTFQDDDNEEEANFEETPVLLFCRNLGKGYVYCGELSYMAHEPSEIPIRFVWRLDDFEYLQKSSKPFRELVKSCGELVG